MKARTKRQTLQPCATPRCPNLTRATRCDSCATVADQPWGGKTGWQDLPANWGQLSAQVLHEEPSCRCGCGRPSQTVDHIVPRSQGGTNDRGNLQGLARHCHQRKSQREAQLGRQR